MQIRTVPESDIPEADPPTEEQAVFGYAAAEEEEALPPTNDDEAWWLPDEADTTGPDRTWRNCGGQWSPPEG